MTNDPIDDALAHEPTIEVDPAFTASVMAAVHREAMLPPIAFPWRRCVAGALASAAIPLLVALTGVSAPTPEAVAPLAWTAVALTGTWLCYAAAMRVARAVD